MLAIYNFIYNLSPDENYPNIDELINGTMDLKEKSAACATHSNPGIVFITPDSSKKSNAFYQKKFLIISHVRKSGGE